VTFWDFANQHANEAVCVLLILVPIVAYEMVVLVKSVLRHWNIHKHGYPPPHCDADGDFRDEE
jgi:hypothetical protein